MFVATKIVSFGNPPDCLSLRPLRTRQAFHSSDALPKDCLRKVVLRHEQAAQ